MNQIDIKVEDIARGLIEINPHGMSDEDCELMYLLLTDLLFQMRTQHKKDHEKS